MGNVTYRNRNKNALYKDGRKKQPNWEWRFTGAGGKTFSKCGFKTKGEAQIDGNKAYNDYINNGIVFEPSTISVKEYFDYWINAYCIPNVKDSTVVTYKNIIDFHICPQFGDCYLNSLTTQQLQNWFNTLVFEKKLSKNYVSGILRVFRQGLKYAKNNAKFIQQNPALDVILPKNDYSVTSRTKNTNGKDIIILSKDEINAIFDRFRDSPPVYYAMLTAYYTGLRIGEIYGLTWDCIDFQNKQIKVDKCAKTIADNDGRTSTGNRKKGKNATTIWYFGSCKTSTSYRTIDIGDTLINALAELKTKQSKWRKEYGEYYTRCFSETQLTKTNQTVQRIHQLIGVEAEKCKHKEIYPLFVSENGDFRGIKTMIYPSKVIHHKMGINFNFHAFRHTHATMLIDAGVSVKAVSERLGHSSVKTTLETYVHNTQKTKTDAVAKFETVGKLENKGA